MFVRGVKQVVLRLDVVLVDNFGCGELSAIAGYSTTSPAQQSSTLLLNRCYPARREHVSRTI